MRFLWRRGGGSKPPAPVAGPILEDPPFRSVESGDWRGRLVVNPVYARLHGRHVWHRIRSFQAPWPGSEELGRRLTFACYLGGTERSPDRRGRIVAFELRTDVPGPGEHCKDCQHALDAEGRGGNA